MSKTIRRNEKRLEREVLRDCDWWWGWGATEYSIDPKSKEGKRLLAELHGDSGWYNNKGPNWFHNLYTQRPHRRMAERELQQYMINDEYEVIIESNPKREYWS